MGNKSKDSLFPLLIEALMDAVCWQNVQVQIFIYSTLCVVYLQHMRSGSTEMIAMIVRVASRVCWLVKLMFVSVENVEASTMIHYLSEISEELAEEER